MSMFKNKVVKSCRECRTEFEIVDEDFRFYDKLKVPPPTLCPPCREQRRLSFHNERRLYKRTCDATGDSIISHISPDKPYIVYKQSYWWSDNWDPMSYGREVDFSRPFFDQLRELDLEVPNSCLFTDYLLDENSDYTNYSGRSKNCYLIAHADYNRDCYYGYGVKRCESCCDIYNLVNSELCYECIDCYGCYNLIHGQDCLNCSESLLLKDCVGCKNCIGCFNLRHKQYWIFNKAYTKEEYQQFLSDHPLGSYLTMESLCRRFEEFCMTMPRRYLHMLNCDNSLGDQLVNCKNVKYSYEVSDAEDVKYCTQLKLGAKDCMDVHQFGTKAELLYECAICGHTSQNLRFCSGCTESSSDLTYCMGCFSSRQLFGCLRMRNAQYCVLNKQYSEAEYLALVSKIIQHMKACGEWGEFFPMTMSQFSYNETRAQEFFPLTKQQVLKLGLRWQDEITSVSQSATVVLPDLVSDAEEGLCAELLTCVSSGKPYRLQQQEIAFYKKLNIPIPRKCPDQRYQERQAKKNPRQLWPRNCDRCSSSIQSSWPASSKALVYCEECFLQQAD